MINTGLTSKIGINPIFYSKISDDERNSFVFKCKFLQKVLQSMFNSDDEILIDLIYSPSYVNTSLRNIIVTCRKNAMTQEKFDSWLIRNKQLWKFILNYRIWSNNEFNILIPALAELTWLENGVFLVESIAYNSCIEFDNYGDAVVEFKKLIQIGDIEG